MYSEGTARARAVMMREAMAPHRRHYGRVPSDDEGHSDDDPLAAKALRFRTVVPPKPPAYHHLLNTRALSLYEKAQKALASNDFESHSSYHGSEVPMEMCKNFRCAVEAMTPNQRQLYVNRIIVAEEEPQALIVTSAFRHCGDGDRSDKMEADDKTPTPSTQGTPTPSPSGDGVGKHHLTPGTTVVDDSFLPGSPVPPMITLSQIGCTTCIRLLVTMCSARFDVHGNVTIDGDEIKDAPPMWIAAAFGHIKVVDFLIDSGADVNITTPTNSTPLRAACFDGRLAVVKLLVEKGHADVEIANRHGHTCLMIASFRGRMDVVQYLLTKCGAQINRQSERGNTALHDAAEAGYRSVVSFLLSQGMKVVPDQQNVTPPSAAAWSGNEDVVEAFRTSPHYTMPPLEEAHVLELLGAALMLKKQCRPQYIMRFWRRALSLRRQHGLPNPAEEYLKTKCAETLQSDTSGSLRLDMCDEDDQDKSGNHDWLSPFSWASPYSSDDELTMLQANNSAAMMTACAIGEHLIGGEAQDLHYFMRNQACVLLQNAQYKSGCALLLHSLKCTMRTNDTLCACGLEALTWFSRLSCLIVCDALSGHVSDSRLMILDELLNEENDEDVLRDLPVDAVLDVLDHGNAGAAHVHGPNIDVNANGAANNAQGAADEPRIGHGRSSQRRSKVELYRLMQRVFDMYLDEVEKFCDDDRRVVSNGCKLKPDAPELTVQVALSLLCMTPLSMRQIDLVCRRLIVVSQAIAMRHDRLLHQERSNRELRQEGLPEKLKTVTLPGESTAGWFAPMSYTPLHAIFAVKFPINVKEFAKLFSNLKSAWARSVFAMNLRLMMNRLLGYSGEGDSPAPCEPGFATPSFFPVNLPDKKGCSPLILAAKVGESHSIDLLNVALNDVRFDVHCIDPETGKNLYTLLLGHEQPLKTLLLRGVCADLAPFTLPNRTTTVSSDEQDMVIDYGFQNHRAAPAEDGVPREQAVGAVARVTALRALSRMLHVLGMEVHPVMDDLLRRQRDEALLRSSASAGPALARKSVRRLKCLAADTLANSFSTRRSIAQLRNSGAASQLTQFVLHHCRKEKFYPSDPMAANTSGRSLAEEEAADRELALLHPVVRFNGCRFPLRFSSYR